MSVSLPDFFIFYNERPPLNSCEENLIRGFGHSEANFSQMGYISRGKVEIDFSVTNSGQSVAIFFTEKYSKSLTIKSFTKNNNNETTLSYTEEYITEYEIARSPVAKTIDLFFPTELCKQYTCLKTTFAIQFTQMNDFFTYDELTFNSNIIKKIFPSSIILGYNCIGWALGVET